MEISSLYRYYMYENADQRTIQWGLTSPQCAVFIISLYLYIVLKAGPDFMKNRKAFDLKRVIQVYNIVQVIYCCVIIYQTVIHGLPKGESMFGCYLVDYSNNPTAVSFASTIWWCYVLKIIELIETVFFILRKKNNQVSTLHLYHHVSTYITAWAGLRYIAGGMVAVPIILNCFVHVLMYTYYFLATLGPDWQKTLAKWKAKLTMLQMIQFCILIFHACSAFRENCEFPKTAAVLFLPNVVVVFYMFYDFYKKAYCTSKVQKVN